MARRRQVSQEAVIRHHVNPRFRAFGKARIDIAKRVRTQEDWDTLWKQPANGFPFSFSWASTWRQCFEYKVDDFAAEVGFFIDILGLPVNAFSPDYAMFTSPNGDFSFGVVSTQEGEPATPPDTVRIQFMVADILDTVAELERRGIVFEQKPQPVQEGSSLLIAYFRTPHGICLDLWGEADEEEPEATARIRKPADLSEEEKAPDNEDEMEHEGHFLEKVNDFGDVLGTTTGIVPAAEHEAEVDHKNDNDSEDGVETEDDSVKEEYTEDIEYVDEKTEYVDDVENLEEDDLPF